MTHAYDQLRHAFRYGSSTFGVAALAAMLAAGPAAAAEQGAAAKQAAADLAAGKTDDPIVLKAPAPNGPARLRLRSKALRSHFAELRHRR